MPQVGYYSPWMDAAGVAGNTGNDLARVFLGLAQMKRQDRRDAFQQDLQQRELAQRDRSFEAHAPLLQAQVDAQKANAQWDLARSAELTAKREATTGALSALNFGADGAQGPVDMSGLLKLIAMSNPEALLRMDRIGANQVGVTPLGQRTQGPITLNPGESYQAGPEAPQTLNTNFPPRALAGENDVALMNGLMGFLEKATALDELEQPVRPELLRSPAYTNAIPLLNSLIQGQGNRVQQKYNGTNQQPAVVGQPQTAPPKKAAGVKEGATATNPKTGEKIIFRDGQWQPL